MLRVCGVTYTHTTNYGTCLQAYALQVIIENMTIGGEKCNYELVPVGRYPWIINGKDRSIIKKIISKVKGIVVGIIKNHYQIPFHQFESKFMHFSDCPSIQELPNLNKTKDAFICGSDVIWNPKYNCDQSFFYLDFAQKYAFSYAASFGGARFERGSLNDLKDKLAKLNAISVREKQGAEIVKQCLDKNAIVAVDPVLLLNSEDWDSVVEPNRSADKYIFVYTIGMRPIVKECIEKLKKETGLRVVYSTGNLKASLQQGIFQVQTPQRWLRLIRDAEYVITNSFHGTAFSVIFHKNFFVPVRGEIDQSFNVRMYNLLSKVGLIDRMFNAVPSQIALSMPDYSQVDRKLNEMKEASLSFLKENLEAAYQEKLKLEQKEQ